jgi:hypothetical protein
VTVQGVLTTRIQPAPIGHLITVSLAYTNYRRPLTVQLQTVITKFSGGQP